MSLMYRLYDSEFHNEHMLIMDDPTSVKSMNDYGRQCNEIRASGNELKYILLTFTGIPIAQRLEGAGPGGVPVLKNADTMRWSGETAAFIAMNFG